MLGGQDEPMSSKARPPPRSLMGRAGGRLSQSENKLCFTENSEKRKLNTAWGGAAEDHPHTRRCEGRPAEKATGEAVAWRVGGTSKGSRPRLALEASQKSLAAKCRWEVEGRVMVVAGFR